MDQTKDPKELVAYQYALGFDLGNGRTIQVNGTFMLADGTAAMNSKLDQMWAVLERLRAKVQVEQVELELKTAHSRMNQMKEMMIRIEAGADKRKELKQRLTTQQESEIANTRANMLSQEASINDLETALAEVRLKAA